jgi:hypothetical protein
MAKNKGFKGNKKSADRFKQPKKGSGKVKYKNVVKEERVNTRKSAKEVESRMSKITGKKLSQKDISRRAEKKGNVARIIDIEDKERRGVRTPKPSTPKVPVKRSTASRSGAVGMRIGGGFGKTTKF